MLLTIASLVALVAALLLLVTGLAVYRERVEAWLDLVEEASPALIVRMVHIVSRWFVAAVRSLLYMAATVLAVAADPALGALSIAALVARPIVVFGQRDAVPWAMSVASSGMLIVLWMVVFQNGGLRSGKRWITTAVLVLLGWGFVDQAIDGMYVQLWLGLRPVPGYDIPLSAEYLPYWLVQVFVQLFSGASEPLVGLAMALHWSQLWPYDQEVIGSGLRSRPKRRQVNRAGQVRLTPKSRRTAPTPASSSRPAVASDTTMSTMRQPAASRLTATQPAQRSGGFEPPSMNDLLGDMFGK